MVQANSLSWLFRPCARFALAGAAALIHSAAVAANGSWKVDADGNWSTASNWDTGTVPGTTPGDVVSLTNNLSASRVVTIDSTSRTVGTLLIGDPVSSFFSYTLAASGGAGLSFTNSGSTAYLIQTNNTSASDTISAPLTLSDSLFITNKASLTLSGGIAGNSGKGLTKGGAGTLFLSGANTYSGGTTIRGGTLQLGSSDALPVAGAVTLGGTNALGNLNLGTYSQTISSLTASSSTAANNLVTIGAGQALVINGAGGLFLGTDTGAGSTTQIKMSGGGALLVTNAAALVTVGKGQASQNYYNTCTLDLSELSSVTLNSTNEIRLAYGQTSTGTLTLSNTNNLLSAKTLQIGNSVSFNAGTGTLILGTGTNVLAADTINIGLIKATGVVRFASQADGPGSVTIGGKTRSTAEIIIGSKGAFQSGAVPTGLLDLRGHAATVAAGTVTIGREENTGSIYTGGASGTFYFASGTLTATNLLMGVKIGVNTGVLAKATGILTVSGGVFTVTGGPVTLASQTGAGTAAATLNINAGTFRTYADIRTGPSNCTGIINLDGGTLDMTGRAIGLGVQTVTAFNALSGTLMNLGEFNNGAALVKSGSGALTLDGTNAYTGATMISNGTLTLGGAGLLGGGNYAAAIGNSGALVCASSGDQILSGPVTGSGTLTQSGSGTLTLAGSTPYSGATAVNAGRLAVVSGGSLSNSAVSLASGAALSVQVLSGDGQWSCKSLTVGSGTATADFRFYGVAPSATVAPLLVSGDLVNNGTLNATVECSGGASVAVGTYPLIRYTGALTVGTLGAVALPNGGVGSLSNNTASSTIDLNVAVAGSTLIWNGGSGSWDINATANWKDGHTYLEGDAVLFDDTSSGTAPFTVALATAVNPGSVTVANSSAADYTLSGPGALAGDAALTKSGNGTLVLAGTNTYRGGTSLDSNAGTVRATLSAAHSAIGTGPATVGAGSVLQLDNIGTAAGTVTKTNALSGAGTLKLTFAANATARATALPGLSGFGGTVQVGESGTATGDKLDASGLAAPSAGVQIADGNTLYIGAGTGAASFSNITVRGSGNAEGRGAIRLGASTASLSGPVTLLADATIASDAAGATLSGDITGSAAGGATNTLTQGAGASASGCVLSGVIGDGANGGRVALAQTKGVLTLSGANTFSGATTVSGGGTLLIGANNTLPVTASPVLGSTNSAGHLTLSAFSQTLAGLAAVSPATSQTNLVTVGLGQALVINGTNSLAVGTEAGTSTTAVKMTGGGALVVTNASAKIIIGKTQTNVANNHTGWLDLSGLSSVVLGSSATPIGEIRIAYGLKSSGFLLLSNTNNLLTASALYVGHCTDPNQGNGTLTLGAGTNVLAVDAVNLGLGKASGTMSFASQAAGSPGSVTLGGRTRGTAELVLGSKLTIASGAVPTGILDLRGHLANIAAGTVMIGREDNNTGAIFTGGATGSLLFDAGTFTATNLVMAYWSGPNTGVLAKATATLTVSGGVFTVTTVGTNAFTLATQRGAGTALATVNALGGVLRSYSDIRTGPTNCTGTINLDGGTLDLTGRAIGMGSQTVTVFNARSGTLMNLGAFNNGAPLVKTGGGTLSLDGTNTYSGATVVSNGTLRLASTNCLPLTADLYLTTGTTVQPDYSGILTIRSLYIDGEVQRAKVYSQADLPAFLSGTGSLQTVWPPPRGTVIRIR